MNNNLHNDSTAGSERNPDMVRFAKAHAEMGMGSESVTYYVLVTHLLAIMASTIWDGKGA